MSNKVKDLEAKYIHLKNLMVPQHKSGYERCYSLSVLMNVIIIEVR